MCYKTQCKKCKKVTWGGCGKHIDNALAGVREEDRCEGWRTGQCTFVPDPNSAAAGQTPSGEQPGCIMA